MRATLTFELPEDRAGRGRQVRDAGLDVHRGVGRVVGDGPERGQRERARRDLLDGGHAIRIVRQIFTDT